MIDFAHVIVDLQAGDTGKGKIAHSLLKGGLYTHCIRYNGGSNAGHTIYHEGNKIVLHSIPVGIIHGIKSIIGPGCVLNVNKLLKEIKDLEKANFKIRDKLFIDKRTHIVTEEHITEDSNDTLIGTTKTGNGPCYRDKYSRKGIRAEQIEDLQPYLTDIYAELFNPQIKAAILCEGAQGFELDPDWGDYPFVTSSHCTVGSASLNGIPPQKITRVYGIAKAYRTYVGNKKFEKTSEAFTKIREIGQEFGATTGRKRQVGWLDINHLIMSANINGVTNLIINKLDVLKQVELSCYFDGNLKTFNHTDEFKNFITDKIQQNCELIKSIDFSETPYDI